MPSLMLPKCMRSDIVTQPQELKPRSDTPTVANVGKILPVQRRAKGTKMTPKQWSVKSMATVLLPILCSVVEYRVKITSA